LGTSVSPWLAAATQQELDGASLRITTLEAALQASRGRERAAREGAVAAVRTLKDAHRDMRAATKVELDAGWAEAWAYTRSHFSST
jgi:hypothetical protein